jgi:di/tricarboxylate transporter
MNWQIGIVLIIVFASAVLFISERFRVDLVALMAMVAVLFTGTVTPEDGISGFSNTATVTVGAMFILSAGLFRTGALNFVGASLSILGRRRAWVAMVPILVFTGVASAFVNNTAVVAILLPILLEFSRFSRTSPSKILMPVSFASMFGGVCTLIGTSTNILVNSIAVRHGQSPFKMFEFTPLGVLFFVLGSVYMLFIGARLIPQRRISADLTTTYATRGYLTEIEVLPEAKSVGKLIPESPLVNELDLEVIAVIRNGRQLLAPIEYTSINAGDILKVKCDVQRIKGLQSRAGIRLLPATQWLRTDPRTADRVIVEAVVAPNSVLDRATLKSIRFDQTFGGIVLAIGHRGQIIHDRTETAILRGGDTLLVEVPQEHLDDLMRHDAFVFVSHTGLPSYRRSKMLIALIIIAGVIGVAACGWMPIVTTAIAGSVLMIVTGCLTLDEAYKAVDWKIIFLLAGVLTLGVALEKSGAATLLSAGLVSGAHHLGPVFVVSALYLLTSILTEAMSNNATAALLAPIAIAAAEALQVDSRPFLMAVTFAASASFMTPVGYQTNTLIYGPGQYRFADFVRVGGPLNVLFWIMATFLIPRFWAF